MTITTSQTQDRSDSSTGSGSKIFRRLGLLAAAGAAAVSISLGVTLNAVADNRGGDMNTGPTRTEFTPIAPADAPRFTPIAPADAPRFTPIAPAPADSRQADRGAADSDGNKGKRDGGARGAR